MKVLCVTSQGHLQAQDAFSYRSYGSLEFHTPHNPLGVNVGFRAALAYSMGQCDGRGVCELLP